MSIFLKEEKYIKYNTTKCDDDFSQRARVRRALNSLYKKNEGLEFLFLFFFLILIFVPL